MGRVHRSTRLLGALLLLATLLVSPFGITPTAAQSANAAVVISQVYGAGGNSGALRTNDYVELFNRSAAPVTLTGMSVQYASATGTGNFSANPIVALSGTLQPGQYYLVQLAGGINGVALPTPDATGSINAAGGAGKFVLVDGTTGLACNGGSNPCTPEQSARIIDLVGYGNANFFEGSGAAPTLNATLAAFRADGGCTDTNQNNADFATGTPDPRNTSAALNVCSNGGDPTPTAPSIGTQPQSATINAGDTTTLSVVASGSEPLSYQWYTGNSGDTTNPISGATGSSYTTPALPVGSFTYWVRVSNSAGSVDSATATITVNAAVPVCEQPFTPIYAIQGSGATAAITGPVTTLGVVVGDYEGPSPALRGFYIQDPLGDGDPTTSDGIFVFNGNNNSVNLGDLVRVSGNAGEFEGQTQISGTLTIVNCGTGTVAPTDVVLPVASADYLERYEGMLVRFPQTLYVTEHFQLGRFGQIVMSANDRLRQPTNVTSPGAAANALQAANNLNRIIVDDALNNQNADPILFGRNGNPLSASNTLRGGDSATGMVGVLTFTWAGNAASGNAYRLRPVGALGGGVPNFQAANPRPTAAPDVGGSLKVASFNVLNYFLTIDTTASSTVGDCGPLQNVDCRGADSVLEFERQRAKLTQALLDLDADIIGLIEIENTPGVSAEADIAAALNAALGAEIYSFIDTGVIGTDAIRVGFVYKQTTVAPVGNFATLTSAVNPLFEDNRNRPPLAQTFREISTNAAFTVVVNHFKSKGASGLDAASATCAVNGPASEPNCDQGDGQGFWNASRTNAALAMMDWIASDPTGSKDPDYLIIGDLNSYAKEDPIAVIEEFGYVNLVEAFGGVNAYSYVFDGQWGYLDHALASPSLVAQVTGTSEYLINADEPNVLDYNVEFKSMAQLSSLFAPDAFRTSDHDPVLIGLNLTPPLYRAVQVGARVWIERNIALAGLGDFDGDPVDGWALVGRTNGASDNGELRGFFIDDGIPYAIVFNRSKNKGDRCILIVPRNFDVVRKGQTRLVYNLVDPFPCPAP
jgi:predicted extracellular nuclease